MLGAWSWGPDSGTQISVNDPLIGVNCRVSETRNCRQCLWTKQTRSNLVRTGDWQTETKPKLVDTVTVLGTE